MTSSEQEPVIAVLAEQWSAIAELGDELGTGEWDLPSECPGWTVRDLVSHMIGTERSLLGESAPPAPPTQAPHVRNPVGASNEAWVEARRSQPGRQVLDEFRDVTGRRLEQLRSFGPERFERAGPSPVGEVPYREFMQVRVMDCWAHEQDMRVATGRPGHVEGAPAVIALDRMVSALPFIVGKRAGVAEGTSVRFELTAPADRHVDVIVREGRARAEPVGQPDAVLVFQGDAFWRLCCGRVSGDAALDAGLVAVRGDDEMGRRVVQNMDFMI
ncbi:MAG TPA: maleylpyruvate isomerase family mycothiol-dependent enzyme [Acidimicrobiales bacterium]|nr:maleylpyruvate isomerase family mycothiol-dependent enzyme [Acidimicrobiales bacterium]